MKRLDLRRIIQEEVQKVLSENLDAYSLSRLANNVGTGPAEEFLAQYPDLDLDLIAKAITQKQIDKYELRDIVRGDAHKFKVKQFMKKFLKN